MATSLKNTRILKFIHSKVKRVMKSKLRNKRSSNDYEWGEWNKQNHSYRNMKRFLNNFD